MGGWVSAGLGIGLDYDNEDAMALSSGFVHDGFLHGK